jgi:hypothetical protein
MGSLETLSRLETVSRQHFYCLGLGLGLEPNCLGLGLGLEPNCLGLSLGLEPHCLGLVPRQEISRQLQLLS